MKRSLSLSRLLWHWAPILMTAGVIYFLSDQPDLKSGLAPAYDLILRKLAHGFEYALLTFLATRAFYAGHRVSLRWAALGALVIAVLYAVSDEYHQGFVRGRHGAPHDVVIDTLGAGVGAWLFTQLAKWGRKKN